MKNLLIFIFLLASIGAFSQNNLIISGTMMQTSVHQGGVQVPDDFYLPYALSNYTLLLVKFEDVDSIPKVIKSFTSNGIGMFSVKVEPGTYGFIALNDSVIPNQYLPSGFYEESEMLNGSSMSWTLNNELETSPIVVIDQSITDLLLTKHSYSWCGMCP